MSLIPELPDYNEMTLTGDWGGMRRQLAERGILFDLNVTQIVQDNAHGGRSTNGALAYSGTTDYLCDSTWRASGFGAAASSWSTAEPSSGRASTPTYARPFRRTSTPYSQ